MHRGSILSGSRAYTHKKSKTNLNGYWRVLTDEPTEMQLCDDEKRSFVGVQIGSCCGADELPQMRRKLLKLVILSAAPHCEEAERHWPCSQQHAQVHADACAERDRDLGMERLRS
eukprot:4011114-Pleurochrysis_carterae.AAC.2